MRRHDRQKRDIHNVGITKVVYRKVLYNNTNVLERRKNHYETILSTEFPHPPISQTSSHLDLVLTIAETKVEEALKNVKLGKSIGPDDIVLARNTIDKLKTALKILKERLEQ